MKYSCLLSCDYENRKVVPKWLRGQADLSKQISIEGDIRARANFSEGRQCLASVQAPIEQRRLVDWYTCGSDLLGSIWPLITMITTVGWTVRANDHDRTD